jgi:polysaccharide pyruvyl transferase WcaK-like protein
MLKLYGHGGSGNHGCEAIVRSTVGILGDNITLLSNHPEQDVSYGVDQICQVAEDTDTALKRMSVKWFLSSLETKITGKFDLYFRYTKEKLMAQANKGDVFLSIGGDNYCYPGTEHLATINHNLRKKGVKTVLWGCSVEPNLLDNPIVAKDLAGFDLITARETISYEALKKVNPNTVLVADPAFTLERKDLPLPEGWVEGKMVGINASPLILSSGDGQLVLDAYRNLIQHILSTTDMSVVLVPHVVWDSNDDRKVLTPLYEEFRHTGRVILLGDHNCMEIKGYIARCRFFIGARTHATIAAYSSCVPTLVLGYSVKSRGIARDLFGTEENYVIPVQGMTDSNALADGFTWLKENEEEITVHLKGTMPEYVQRAYRAAEEVKKLM